MRSALWTACRGFNLVHNFEYGSLEVQVVREKASQDTAAASSRVGPSHAKPAARAGCPSHRRAELTTLTHRTVWYLVVRITFAHTTTHRERLEGSIAMSLSHRPAGTVGMPYTGGALPHRVRTLGPREIGDALSRAHLSLDTTRSRGLLDQHRALGTRLDDWRLILDRAGGHVESDLRSGCAHLWYRPGGIGQAQSRNRQWPAV